MRTCLLLILSLAVAAGLPVQDWVPVESVDVAQKDRNLLLADLLPEHGHVVQENPEPAVRKESLVQEKPAEPNLVQQNELVNVKSLAEDVRKQEAEANEVVKEIELKKEPVMDEPKDQDEALTEQKEQNSELNVKMPEIAQENLAAQDPVMEQDAVLKMQEVHQRNLNKFVEDPLMDLEPQKTLVEEERNVLQKEVLIEAEEPEMKPELVSEVQEVHQQNLNEFEEEALMDLEPDETSLQEERKILQEGIFADTEEPEMKPEFVSEVQEVHQRNPNEFVEEPLMDLEPDETSLQEERNVLQEGVFVDAEEPEMKPEFVSEVQEVNQRNPNEFEEEALMDLEPDETLMQEERNVLQEGVFADAEQSEMKLEIISEVQEVQQQNPNEFEEEPFMDLEPDETSLQEERNVLQEGVFVDAEEPEMKAEFVSQVQEVNQQNPNEFEEEALMNLEPDETSLQEERNVLQQEVFPDAEQPEMKPEIVSEVQEVNQQNPNEFEEEPFMDLEPDETSLQEERNVLQEGVFADAEQPEMKAEFVSQVQEVNQRNPNEFEEEALMDLEPDATSLQEERNVMQEEELMEAGYLADEETLIKLMESEYPKVEEPMLAFEPSQEQLFMQDHVQREMAESAEYKPMESLIREEELMMADQSLMNENVIRETRSLTAKETANSDPSNNRWRTCNGVVVYGKCYQFFRGPKKAADAEFFCQQHFPNGHLASVTSSYIHRLMMELMDKNGGRTRTWIGGLRYLDTGRFIWLDGAHWGYADWLPGEPNNTAGVENCVELLSYSKFNDMPCWDLRAFICSYPFS